MSGLRDCRVILLDAMGVIYQSGDDVAELLVPFVQRYCPTMARPVIEQAYLCTSLGHQTAADFWRGLGLPPSVEDDYLGQHRLMPGLEDLLDWAEGAGLSVACLSNDVAEWSRKLRARFGLETRVRQWFISGELGLRKPDPAIYHAALAQLDVAAHEVLFIDDRPANVAAARATGMSALHFAVDAQGQGVEAAWRAARNAAS